MNQLRAWRSFCIGKPALVNMSTESTKIPDSWALHASHTRTFRMIPYSGNETFLAGSLPLTSNPQQALQTTPPQAVHWWLTRSVSNKLPTGEHQVVGCIHREQMMVSSRFTCSSCVINHHHHTWHHSFKVVGDMTLYLTLKNAIWHCISVISENPGYRDSSQHHWGAGSRQHHWGAGSRGGRDSRKCAGVLPLRLGTL